MLIKLGFSFVWVVSYLKMFSSLFYLHKCCCTFNYFILFFFLPLCRGIFWQILFFYYFFLINNELMMEVIDLNMHFGLCQSKKLQLVID